MDPVLIHPASHLTTLINVFTVTREHQEELVRLLDQATDDVMRHLPGFVSASIHASSDGTRVTNYAQWASPESYEAMLAQPAAQAHMGPAAALAETFDPHVYSVRSTHTTAAPTQ